MSNNLDNKVDNFISNLFDKCGIIGMLVIVFVILILIISCFIVLGFLTNAGIAILSFLGFIVIVIITILITCFLDDYFG